MNATAIDPRTWNGSTIRDLERSSIRAFMEESREYLKGRVLDFGAGKQPYRDLVDGEYVPFDIGYSENRKDWMATQPDAIICNQMLQYCGDPSHTIDEFENWLKPGGYLVMTGPTNWAEVESSDLFRFTLAGVRHLLASYFEVLVLRSRASISLGGFELSLGWGLVARKP